MTDSFKENELLVPRSLLSHNRTGAIVTVRGDDGRDYRGRVMALEGESARIRTFEELPFPSESRLHITLIQALPKKERMESIIQKATELGVNRIIPCTSAKSVRIGEGRNAGQDKSHKWPTVALKAVEQCRRRTAPVIASCVELREAIGMTEDATALKLILYEKEKDLCLKSALTRNSLNKVIIACGPEGGFTEEEISFAREKGFLPLRLGGRIMRCETAAISTLSILQYIKGDLG